MNNGQQEDRVIATRQFMHSLNELEVVLQAEPDVFENGEKTDPSSQEELTDHSPHPLREEAFGDMLDEAVQDIEQFMSNAPREGNFEQ